MDKKDPRILHKVERLIGLAHLINREYEKAFKCFKHVDAKDLLCYLANICLNEEVLNVAVDSFHFIGDFDGLNKCGQMYFSQGWLNPAIYVFTLAGNSEMIMACHNAVTGPTWIETMIKECLEKNNLDKLEKLGFNCLWERRYTGAFRFFQAAQSVTGLIKCGYACMKKGQTEIAREAFACAAALQIDQKED